MKGSRLRLQLLPRAFIIDVLLDAPAPPAPAGPYAVIMRIYAPRFSPERYLVTPAGEGGHWRESPRDRREFRGEIDRAEGYPCTSTRDAVLLLVEAKG